MTKSATEKARFPRPSQKTKSTIPLANIVGPTGRAQAPSEAHPGRYAASQNGKGNPLVWSSKRDPHRLPSTMKNERVVRATPTITENPRILIVR